MANIIRLTAGQVANFTSMGFTAADFNSLANGSFVLASSAIDNTTNLDTMTDAAGQMTVGGTTSASSYLLLWRLPLNRDGSTYGDGTTSGSTLPGSRYLADSTTARAGITSGNVLPWMFERILVPRNLFKWGISQHLGAALNAAAGFQGEFRNTNLNTNG